MHISEINKLARKNNIAFKTHAILRMQERKISAKEIKDVLCNGEIIAEYKDDFPLPSCLILGKTLNKRHIHTVVAVDTKNKMLWLITVYEPTLSDWEVGFKIRRRKK